MTRRRVPPEPLPVRRIRFEYPDDLDPVWVPRFPELAAAANSVSLIMPYAEPYFAKAVRSVIDQLPPDQRGPTEDFVRQELQHQMQHRRFNDLIVARYPRIIRLEGWMRRTYGWMWEKRSQKYNLAFVAGSETIAYALARWTEKHMGTLFRGADPVASTLFMWHLAEEVEHKSAAFDVFEALDGSRLRYAYTSAISLVLLGWFVFIGSLMMLGADRRLFNPISWMRLVKYSVSLGFEILPTLAVSALPGHHPSQLADPVFLPAWLDQFDPETGTIPAWDWGRAA